MLINNNDENIVKINDCICNNIDKNDLNKNKINDKYNNINKIENNKIKNKFKNKLYFYLIIYIYSIELVESSEGIFDSEIILKIIGTGTQQILNGNYIYLPNQVFVNDEEVSVGKTITNLINETNVIKMVWNYTVTNCSNMFYDLSNIIEVDLSNFDSSKVISMERMFQNCNNMKYINLSNLNTSSVTSVRWLFYKCHNLISLDLSSFDTSSVKLMWSMFAYCSKLKSLDLSNFNTALVTEMQTLFYSDYELEYINFRNINSNSLENMLEMFYCCSNLKNINFFSLSEIKNINYQNIFYNVNTNFQYCINDETKIPKFFVILKSRKRDCSNKCFNVSKILTSDNKCVLPNDSYYKYEYNNIRYIECPPKTKISLTDNYTCIDLVCPLYFNFQQNDCIDSVPEGYYINSTQSKTIDKCHSNCKTCDKGLTSSNSNCNLCQDQKIFDLGNCVSTCQNGEYLDTLDNITKCKCTYNKKCFRCSEESNQYNLCISCNNAYYPKLNDPKNIKTFIECYKDPEGFFLQNEKYVPCFSTCKKCNEYGNEYEQKCLECISTHEFKNESINISNCYQKCENYYYFDKDNKYHCTINEECTSEYNKLIKEKRKCIDSCNNDDLYKYEFNNSCYIKCPNGTIFHNETYKCELIPISTILTTINIKTKLPLSNIKTNIQSSLFMDYMPKSSIISIEDKLHNSSIINSQILFSSSDVMVSTIFTFNSNIKSTIFNKYIKSTLVVSNTKSILISSN